MAIGRWEKPVIICLVLLVYAGTVDNDFHFDDDHSIVRNEHLQSLLSIPRSFIDAATFSGDPQHGLMYRPVVVTSLILNYAVSELEPWSYHLTNVLLHIGFCLLVLTLLKRWHPTLARHAWMAVAILSIHPINSQIVNYVSARAGILAALGLTGALLASGLAGKGARFAGPLILHLGGLLSKSTAVILLPLLVVRTVGKGQNREFWRLPLLALAISTSIYIIAASATRFLGPSLSQLVRPIDVQVMTQLKACVYYLWLLIMPTHLSVIHSFTVAWEPGLAVPTAAALLVTIVVLALRAWAREGGTVSYGVLWFFGALGVTFLMPLHVVVSEHRLYLSSLGVVLFGLSIVGSHPPRGGRGLFFVALALFSLMTVARTAVWQSELSLWTAALRQAPDSPRVHANVARSHFLKGDLEQARERYLTALAQFPDNPDVMLDLGGLEERLGRSDEAGRLYRRTLEINPDEERALRALGTMLAKQGDAAAALPYLVAAAAAAPGAAVLTRLAMVRRVLGDVEGGRRDLEAAVAMDPDFIDALVNLGGLHQERALAVAGGPIADLAVARGLYERVLELDSTHQEALLNLAALYAQQGQTEQALGIYQRLVHDHPKLAAGYAGLANVFGQMGDLAAATRAMVTATALDSLDAEAWVTLGGFYASSQQWSDATRAFEQALALGDQRPQNHYNLAEILAALGYQAWEQGERPRAREYMISALAHYRSAGPDYRRSAQRIQQLERRLR